MHSPEHMKKKRIEFDKARADLIDFLCEIKYENCERVEGEKSRFEEYEALEENFRAALDFWTN